MVETERRATRAIRAKEAAAESGDGIVVIDVFVGVMGVGARSRLKKEKSFDDDEREGRDRQPQTSAHGTALCSV